MAAIERRYTNVAVELRASGDNQKIGGYAAVFWKLSHNLGGFVERSADSAMNNWAAQNWPEVICRFDHDNGFLLGTTAARTLELRTDKTGLLYEVIPPRARADILELTQRGDIRQSSFAFRTPPEGDEWGLSDQGYPMRTLVNVQLVDVAPVVQPAYPDTTVGLRSLAAKFDAPLDEVRSLAQANELRKFFVRTDGPSPQPPKRRLSGAAALARIREREGSPL
jgi:HK97 family phage prohead protease